MRDHDRLDNIHRRSLNRGLHPSSDVLHSLGTDINYKQSDTPKVKALSPLFIKEIKLRLASYLF